MKKIKDQKKIEISFDKGIYPLVSIKEAISDYKEVATIKIIVKKEIISTIITEYDDTVKHIDQEFANYVLSIVIAQGNDV